MLERLIKILTSTPEKEDDEEKIKTKLFKKKICKQQRKMLQKTSFQKEVLQK